MQYYEVVIRLLLAILIGGLIGYEREFKNQPAGFRTHILVCIGAAVVSMIQIYDANYIKVQVLNNPQLQGVIKGDMGRLGAQVITGVGFLGAGTIIHEKGSVRGLTTAASIWAVACIGLAIGMGHYFLSMSSALAVLLVLATLKRLENKFFQRKKIIELTVEYEDKSFIAPVEMLFKYRKVKIKRLDFQIEDENKECNFCKYTLVVPKNIKTSHIIMGLSSIKGVVKVSEEA